MSTQNKKESPQICIICSDAHRNGVMHSDWIDMAQSLETIKKQVCIVLATCPISGGAKEFEICDSHNFGGINIKGHTDLAIVKKIADLIVKHGKAVATALEGLSTDIESIQRYLDLVTEHGDAAIAIFKYEPYLDTAQQYLEDYYQGSFSSQMEFAEQRFDDLYGSLIPESVTYFIDYDLFRKQLFTYDYFSLELKGVLHVFACS